MKARYDGLAGWYDREQTRVSERDDAPLEQFAALSEPVGGLIVEVGCGTGLSAATLRRRGWQVGGLDVSQDQLQIARRRCDWVIRGDAHELPLRTAALEAVALAFVHTDVDDFARVLHEAARVLRPGGRLVYLGVHPCFVGPHVDSPTKNDSRLGVVPGYRDAGWVQSSEQFGPGIRRRVGARHLPLAEHLTAFIRAPLMLDRVVELGEGTVPWMLGLTAHRDATGDPPRSLGLARGTTQVRSYDQRWPAEFQREAQRLHAVLAGFPSRVEHIGSTAVPGLAAKPILDIAIGMDDDQALAVADELLEHAGYEFRGDQGNHGGLVYAKGPESARTHYLHVVRVGSDQWRAYLAFRDLLRRDPDQRDQYAELKQTLTQRYPNDRLTYTNGKQHFIEEALTRASR